MPLNAISTYLFVFVFLLELSAKNRILIEYIISVFSKKEALVSLHEPSFHVVFLPSWASVPSSVQLDVPRKRDGQTSKDRFRGHEIGLFRTYVGVGRLKSLTLPVHLIPQHPKMVPSRS